MNRRLFAQALTGCLVVLGSALAFVACSTNPVDRASCNSPDDCDGPRVCQDGYCVQPEDDQPPNVEWMSPGDQSVVNGDVMLAVDATDETTSVERVEFLVDDASDPLATDNDGSDGWTATWNTDEVDNFPHTLTAIAYDAVGNQGSNSITVTVDNSVPEIEFVQPAMGDYIRGNTDPESDEGFTVQWCLPTANPLLATDPFAIRYRGSDDASFGPAVDIEGNEALDIPVDQQGMDCSDSIEDTQPLQSFQWRVPDDNGTAFLEIAATTRSGETTSKRQSFIIDSDFPVFEEPPLQRQSGANIPLTGESISGSIDLQAKVSDPTSEVTEVTFIVEDSTGEMVYSETDSTPEDGFTTTWDTQAGSEPLPDGEYTIDLNATDAVGHTATTRPDEGGEGLTTTVTVDNGGPSVTITTPSEGDVVSGDTQSVEANVSDASTAVDEVDFSVNGSTLDTKSGSNATFDWNTTQTNNGSATVTVGAVDTEGNRSTDTVNVTVDNEPPSNVTIGNPSNSAYVGGSVTIDASATDTHTSVTELELLIDGSSQATESGSSASFNWNSSSVSDGPHNIAVRATDEAGNETETSISVTVDNSPPNSVEITDPSGGEIVSGTVDIAANASDDTGTVQSLELTGPGGSTVNTINGTSGTFMWDSTQTASGTGKTLTVTATDQVGNQASASVTVTVDNDAPSVSFSAPAQNALVSDTVNVEATANDSLSPLSSITLTDSNGQVGSEGSSPASFSWDSSTVSEGTQTLNIEATDQQGNTATTTRTVTVDNSAPSSLDITSHSGGDQVSGTVNLTASATDTNDVTYTFEIDGTSVGSNKMGDVSWNTTNFSDGTVTLEVIAEDDAGNSTSTSINLTVDNGDPTASITDPNDGETASGDVAVNATSSDATTSVTSFTLSIDGTQVTSTSGSDINYTWDSDNGSWSDGPHTLTVEATDELGNTASESISVTLDNTAPTASFSSPGSGDIVGGTIDVTADASDGGSGLSTLTLEDNNGQIGSVSSAPNTFSWDTTRVDDGSRTLTLTATDNEGNTTTETLMVTVDNTVPANVQFNTPADGSVVSGTAVTVEIQGNDNQTSVDALELRDSSGIPIDSDNMNNPATFSWDSTSVSDGQQSLTAVAYDEAGNTTSTSISVTVDNTAPGLTISNPSNNADVTDTVSISASASEPTSSVASMEIKIDGTTVNTASSSNSIGYSWDSTTEPDGMHTVTVSATDTAGNTASETRTVYVDNSAPYNVTFDNLTSNQAVNGTVGVDVSAADDESGIQSISLSDNDGQVGSVASSPDTISWDTTGLSDGSKTLTLTAEDNVGNTTTATLNVVVDNTAPTVNITNPGDGNTLSGSTSIDANASDSQTSVTDININLDGSPFDSSMASSISSSWDTTTGSDGQKTIEVTATDEAGNVGSSTITVSVDNNGPTITFNTLSAGTTVSGSSQTVDPTASDAGSSVASMTLFIDRNQETNVSGSSISATWDTTLSPDGKVRVDVEATDDSGNTSTESIYVTVDNNSVSVTAGSPADGTCVSTGSSVTIDVTPTGYTTPETNANTADLDIDVIYNGNSTEFIKQNADWSNGSTSSITWTAPGSSVDASDLTINVEDTDYEGTAEDDESQDVIENFKVGNCP